MIIYPGLVIRMNEEDGEREMVLLEMQGRLILEQRPGLTAEEIAERANQTGDPRCGCTLGQWETDPKGAPRFRMGNHTLNGKFEELKKPLVLLRRETGLRSLPWVYLTLSTHTTRH